MWFSNVTVDLQSQILTRVQSYFPHQATSSHFGSKVETSMGKLPGQGRTSWLHWLTSGAGHWQALQLYRKDLSSSSSHCGQSHLPSPNFSLSRFQSMVLHLILSSPMLESSQGSGGRAGRRGPGKKIVVVPVVSSALLAVVVLSVVVLVVCCNCSKSPSCSPAEPGSATCCKCRLFSYASNTWILFFEFVQVHTTCHSSTFLLITSIVF